jgi:hypothetical protein
MKRLQKAVVLAELINKMNDYESWCGETHVQKTVYFLQELLKVPTGYEFVLYKHGPFSFDLRDEITDWRAYELFRWEPRHAPYGPSLRATSNAEKLGERYPKTRRRYEKQIAFVARTVGRKGVAELERLATALYVTATMPKSGDEARSERIHELKPHVPMNLALKAVREIDEVQRRAKEFLASLPQ